MATKTIHGRALVVVPINPTSKYTQAWKVIYGLLSGLPHPDGKVDSDNMPKKWVFAIHPDKIISDALDASDEEITSEFPAISVVPVVPSFDTPTVDQKTRDYKFKVKIHLLCSRSDDLDEVFDTIATVMEANTISDYLATVGLFDLTLDDVEYEHEERSGVKIHKRVMTYAMSFESGI